MMPCCSCCDTSRGCRSRSWPTCFGSRRTTCPSGFTGCGPAFRRKWNDRQETPMSEDRLDQALNEMREEAVDAGTLAAARARTWDRVSGATAAGCAEFRADFRAYASGALTGNRRVLLEDHLSRCVACRASIAEMKGERRVIAMPQ